MVRLVYTTQLVAWNWSHATKYYRVNWVACDFFTVSDRTCSYRYYESHDTFLLWPIRVKVNWMMTEGYLKYPNIHLFPWYCRYRVLAVMTIHTCSVAIQTTSARVSMLNRNYFHFICITIVWNMILVLPCRQVSNILQKLHATSFMLLVASCKQALILRCILQDSCN
jgi:hypothetical protein